MNPNPRNMTPCPSPQPRDEGLCKYYDGDDGHTEEYASNYYSRNDAYFNDGGDDDDDAHDGDLKMTTMFGDEDAEERDADCHMCSGSAVRRLPLTQHYSS